MRTTRYRAKTEMLAVGGGDALTVRADYNMPCHLAPDQLNQKVGDFLQSSLNTT